MVILGIGVSLTVGYIVNPIKAFNDMNLRTRLTERADTALYRMTREIRQGIPNSIRIDNSGNRIAIEVLQMHTAGRYRASGTGNALDPTLADGSFDVLGELPGAISLRTGSGKAECLDGSADCIVIYNTGTSATANNAYNGDNVATISGFAAPELSYSNGGTGPAFPLLSPAQRFFVLRQSVSFVCDTNNGEIRQHSGYGVLSVQPVAISDFPSLGNLLSDQVTSCNFQYEEGTNSRNGVVTLEITITEAGESVSLLQQVHIYNSP